MKRMLQLELPEELRNLVTDNLFRRFVTDDEESFSNELYMSIEQITCLQRNGMYVGSHGFDHYWLDSISVEQQRNEIEMSLQFLEELGSNPNRWIMCYPYGAYDETLLSILAELKCSAGLTTKVGIADLNLNPLLLSRLDTNDLPKDSRSAPNEWTIKASL